MDELNEFLECTCGRCDDGKCQCCDCEDEHPQVTTTYEEINYDEYIDNLKYWDQALGKQPIGVVIFYDRHTLMYHCLIGMAVLLGRNRLR